MSEKIKDYLGLAIIFALALFALSVVSYVKTYSKSIEPGSYRSFSVAGEGKVVAIPDIAEISFTVITEGGTNLAELQNENTKKINDAIKFVKSAGVENKDIKTQNYNVSPRYQYYDCRPMPVPLGSGTAGIAYPEPQSCPPPEIIGYTINQSVSVKIRDQEKIGTILSGVVENGANSVYGPSFTIDDPTKIENEARAKAIKNAKTKADAIADAGGFRLGRILSISEGGGYPSYYYKLAETAVADGHGGDLPAPIIEPGSQDVIINVTITYEIR